MSKRRDAETAGTIHGAQEPERIPFTMQQLQLLMATRADVNAAQLRAQLVLNTICAGLRLDPQRILRVDDAQDPPVFVCSPELKE